MVNIKAKKNCRFGYGGTEYVFSEGEEQEVDVPTEKIDTNSFEIKGTSRIEKKEKNKKVIKVEKKEEDEKED